MASNALPAGVPHHVIQRLGNWKTASMVAHYAHVADEQLREGEDRLAEVFHMASQSGEQATKAKP